MKIKRLTATQIVIVQHDEVPLRRLIHKPILQVLTELFNFRTSNVAMDPLGQISGVHLQHGLFESDSAMYTIGRLDIEERRFLFAVDGPTREANAFYTRLVEHLTTLAPVISDDFLRPLLRSHESEIIAHLEFPVQGLLSPEYYQFVKLDGTSILATDNARASLKPAGVAFHVDYIPKDDSLGDQRITLSRKEIRLELRKGHPIQDQVYYSKAPLDTDSHIKMLEKLEETLSVDSA